MNPSRFNHKETFTSSIRLMVTDIHDLCVEKGFYEGTDPKDIREVGMRFMLMVTELAEGFEGIRAGKVADDHCPQFTNEEIEIADAVIRLFDYAGWKNLRLGPAIVAKCAYNESRPHKHGKKA